MEVLHFLKFDHQGVALILRAEFEEPNVNIKDLFRGDLVEVQLLEKAQQKEREIHTYFIKVKPAQTIRRWLGLNALGGYFSLPYGVKDGKVKITFLGSTAQVNAFLKAVEAAGVRYRVISLMDAKFSPHSLMSHLTEKQRRVLVTAYTLGYYDVPKKMGLVQLAQKLALAPSTLDVHLRKAEQRLLYHIINES